MFLREKPQIVNAVLFTGDNLEEVNRELDVPCILSDDGKNLIVESKDGCGGSYPIYINADSYAVKTMSGIVMVWGRDYISDKYERMPESDAKIPGPARAMDGAQEFQNFVSDSFGAEECKIRMDCVRIASACGYTRADAIKEAAKELYLFVLSGR